MTWDFSHGLSASVGERYLSRRSADQFDHFWMGGFVTWDAAVRYRRKR
jgi:outer membrane cobalamin receptor